jgi:hypothetical protein
MNLPDVKLILCPLNYNGTQHVSHTGLAVSAMNTARYLRSRAINVQVIPVRNKADILALIAAEKPTHLIVNALWLPTADLAAIVHGNPSVHFGVLVHSNIAFLQVEPNGIRLLREAVDLELSALGNFSVAANSRAGAQGMQDAWECPSLYLPNLYYLDQTVRTQRRKWSGGTLRIGAFGALRPLKNPTASAFAALSIATNLGTNLEFHVNTGRNDGGWAGRLLAAIQAIYANLPNAKIVQDTWQPWAEFRRVVRNMHLLLQPSFTESFNVVTADGVAEGVPSVVSDVIEWAPDWWKASPDNTEDIARTGRALLNDSHTGQDGFNALTAHNQDGYLQWANFLQAKLV